MSVISFTAGDVFRFTLIKYLATNPERKWANTYEIRAKVDGVETDLTTLANQLVAYEDHIHYTTVRFDRVVIATWEPDSSPYDPTTFISLPLTASGLLDLGGAQPVALNVCMDVGRVPLSGRFGHLFYRGCLSEADVEAPAGKFVLTNQAAKQTNITSAASTAGCDDVFSGADVTFELVMVGAALDTARGIAGLVVRGVAVVPFNHAWFNRTVGP
jgi:hypothetical protein